MSAIREAYEEGFKAGIRYARALSDPDSDTARASVFLCWKDNAFAGKSGREGPMRTDDAVSMRMDWVTRYIDRECWLSPILAKPSEK